jgi:HSP20 family protein
MQEHVEPQYIPVKAYRTADRLMVAVPMPGLEPGDIAVEVTADGRLILDGALRGTLKGVKDLLIDEWNAGGYHRELDLPDQVDGALANVTYGNGVVVVALPISERTQPAMLGLETLGPTRGERSGNAGHPARPGTEMLEQRALEASSGDGPGERGRQP